MCTVGPDSIHPRVLKELAGVITKTPYSAYLKIHGCQVKSSVTRKRETSLPLLRKRKEDPGNYRLVSLTFVPDNIMEYILLAAQLRHMQGEEVLPDSPCTLYTSHHPCTLHALHAPYMHCMPLHHPALLQIPVLHHHALIPQLPPHTKLSCPQH